LPLLPFGDTVGDVISRLAAKISELDTIGFDEMVLLDETVDNPYKIDTLIHALFIE
jgi:hypothetical protein